jgi:hypothetical protein
MSQPLHISPQLSHYPSYMHPHRLPLSSCHSIHMNIGKCSELAECSHRGLHGNKTTGRDGETSGAVNPAIQETSFYAISVST